MPEEVVRVTSACLTIAGEMTGAIDAHRNAAGVGERNQLLRNPFTLRISALELVAMRQPIMFANSLVRRFGRRDDAQCRDIMHRLDTAQACQSQHFLRSE